MFWRPWLHARNKANKTAKHRTLSWFLFRGKANFLEQCCANAAKATWLNEELSVIVKVLNRYNTYVSEGSV